MSAGLNDIIKGADKDLIIGRFIRLNEVINQFKCNDVTFDSRICVQNYDGWLLYVSSIYAQIEFILHRLLSACFCLVCLCPYVNLKQAIKK